MFDPRPNRQDASASERSFALGRIVATSAALDALQAAGMTFVDLLSRHAAGDYGNVTRRAWRRNERALLGGARVLSAYALPTGITVWVITEADRSETSLLLPTEY